MDRDKEKEEEGKKQKKNIVKSQIKMQTLVSKCKQLNAIKMMKSDYYTLC